jgi:cation transport ATPase
MTAAAFGMITPVQGALLQELIDVAVIVNALRALRDRITFPTKALPAGEIRRA